MADKPNTDLFRQLGFTGRDVRHFAVRVFPQVRATPEGLVEAWGAFIGNGLGSFGVGVPTDVIFVSVDPDWEFCEFTLHGRTWPGLAIYPHDGDFSVAFGPGGPRSVVLQDACHCFYAHRYQVVLRHKVTGAFATCDPDIGNEDDEDIG